MPLASTDFQNIRGAFDSTINALGVSAMFKRAAGAAPAIPLVVGFSSPRKDDTAVVNAYGIEAKIITVSRATFPAGEVPAKFDTFEIDGKKFVAQSAHDVMLNATLIGWKCIVTGGR
jgi:hypothetical protein